MANLFGKRFNTRTVLIVVLILLIIVAAYIVIINLPPKEEYLSVQDVLGHKNDYLNQTISVKGYYSSLDGPQIKPTDPTIAGSSGSPQHISIDYSKIENATDRLVQGKIYIFTGRLEKLDDTNPLNTDVILVLSEIDEF